MNTKPGWDPGARASQDVSLVEHDPSWVREYEEEARLIIEALGSRIVAVEHIGSTALPGLVAKPIIDIAVTVPRIEDASECVEDLAAVGYEYVPSMEAELPERRFFIKGWMNGRTRHLHMYEHGNPAFEDYVLFRDFLRAHPDVAREYEALKRHLAATMKRLYYTEAKGPFIRDVVARARADRG